MPPPPPVKKPLMLKAPPPPSATPQRSAKTFSVKDWGGEGEGEKIVLYGASGLGKTTLAAMAPRPVFMGVDDGGRKIRNGITGEVLRAIDGVVTFEDVRAAIVQPDLLKTGETLVIDTITKVEEVAEQYIFANYKTEKGATVKSLEGYGFGKGFRFSQETTRLVLQDLDVLVKRGVNVVLLAQESAAKIANAEGLDYLCNGPKLMHANQFSSRMDVCEWADHVLRIGYVDTTVAAVGGNLLLATKGKITSQDTTRVIFTQGARHFVAKSRTLTEPVISFESQPDNSLWKFLFPQEYA